MRQCPECNELFEGIRCNKCDRLLTKEELEAFQKSEAKSSRKLYLISFTIIIACIALVALSAINANIQSQKRAEMVYDAFFDNQTNVPSEKVTDDYKKVETEETTSLQNSVSTFVDQELKYDENNKIKISGDFSGETLSLIVLLEFDGENISLEVARMLAINVYISKNELTSYLFNGDYTVMISSGENAGLAKYDDYSPIEPTMLPKTYTELMSVSDKEQIGALAIEEYEYMLSNMIYIK